MRDSVMGFLLFSLIATALSVVYVRHQHRIAYLAFQAEEQRRDALADEWGQLLIEENLWSFPHRIEKDATQLLAMRAPQGEEMRFVEMNELPLVAHQDTPKPDSERRGGFIISDAQAHSPAQERGGQARSQNGKN